MKLKLLLLFLVVVGFCSMGRSQTTKPYTHLIITEAVQATTEHNYFELTNMGTETIDLYNFEFSHVGGWDGGTANPWPQVGIGTSSPKFVEHLPHKLLAPGQSYVMAIASDYNPENFKRDPANFRERVTQKEFYTVNKDKSVSTIADWLIHQPEQSIPAKTDSITPIWNILEGWGGREAYFLRHHWVKDDGISKDSAVIDQVGGTWDDTDGKNTKVAHAVAGVTDATFNCVLIRRNSVKTGNLDFNAGRGTDFADSEWIPVPILGNWDHWGTVGWRAVFWTCGNQVNAQMNAQTLQSKTGKVLVDLANSKITVPWGVRRNDSIMFQFKKTPGLAWAYNYSATSADSAYVSARTGDVLTVYACGDQVTQKDFTIETLAPTASDNIVIPKNSYNSLHRRFETHPTPWGGMRITDGVAGMDSITNLAFATRVDSLFKYIEKAPKASWKIVFKSGVAQPDLKTGDILSVTSENNKTKNYFIKLEKFSPASNALLASITWPDMPASFRGDIAGSYGWKGDTIPGFVSSAKTYIVQVPLEYNGIPALAFTKSQLDSKVVVTRAKTLSGTPEDRTVTFKVTAENDTVFSTYTVRFDKEKDLSNIQPFVAEPFISQVVFRSEWSTGFVEIANPGTEIMDLSNYMIVSAWGPEANNFGWNNSISDADFNNRYMKYVPGKRWQDKASWLVQPRILVPDNAVNPMVYGGDVFVMGHMTNCNGFTTAAKHPYTKEMDINFGMVPTTVPGWEKFSNPWGENLNGTDIPNTWCNNGIYIYKILNDSVKNGLKPATNRADFQLIELFGGLDGNNWKPDGFDAGSQEVGFTRKPNIYKGNTVPNGSWNNDKALSEWTHQRPADYNSYNLGWPWTDIAINTGIGALTIDEVTVYRSTVSSKIYKVSPGYSQAETIRGLKTGVTVSDFFTNIIKANTLQSLTVTSGSLTLNAASAIKNGDVLTVLSADSTNTSKYTLSVTAEGLSSNAILTSAPYTIKVNGTTGTIAGFSKNTPLRTVFEGVVVPEGAELTIVNSQDAYMSLSKLNYDTAYVDVIATSDIYFEVIAENGVTKVTYQLQPTVALTDAYVTSDVYSVEQIASVIKYVPVGTSVHSLLENVTPAQGASITVYDKGGFERTSGDIYKDDKLVVTAADGKTQKAYYFSMLNFYANQYLAFVISDDYQVEQVHRVITGPALGSSIVTFKDKLYPSFGASLKVVNESGVENTGSSLVSGDRLLVTAADGFTTATYSIVGVTGVNIVATTSSIKMYPNPTNGRVVVQGLAKGNRVQVFNAAGVTLRDVIVDNSTDYVSLEAQPSGIYIFVVSAGTQHINIQKIVKK